MNQKQLDLAVEKSIISREQATQLADLWFSKTPTTPRFDFTHVLYYLGGLIAIGAMTIFMNLSWETFGGWGILGITLLYAAGGIALANRFRRGDHIVPSGLCAAFVVALTPLAIYGLQQGMGWWPDETAYRDYHRYIKWHWLYMELGTLAAGAIIAYRYRYPFLLMPIALTLWYLSMDLAPLLADGAADFKLRTQVSLYFGLAMLLLSFWIDLRSSRSGDYAFWMYLFGIITFWCGLSLQESESELSKFVYFCINLMLVGVGAVLVRRVFVVFGALGIALYLGYVAHHVFSDMWLFPVALSAIGLGIIYLGLLWQKKENVITRRARRYMPSALRELLEQRRA